MMSQPSSERAAPQYFIWQCLQCGYALVAQDPPELCPDCGGTRRDFIPLEED